ncbi:MAG: sodium/solute symporter [Reichenbachiella sp.]|uniref:sodium:solute symporter family transporter n=1 Tax=Reichenbachiella sp. TaxID=2184521 RepID=UPI00329A275B
MVEFGVLNWTILVGYIAINLLLGYVLSKKVDSAEDFYVGRKTTPWWAIGISVVATYVSAMTFLGAPAWAYKEGLSVIAIHLNYPIVIFIVITYFLPFFYNSKVVSIYDYQEKRFGKTSRSVISIIFMVTQALSSAAVLYGTSLVIGFITGIGVIECILIVAAIALVYTALGGITAVIWTDVVQSAILILGGVVIMYALLSDMPQSFAQTLAELKASGKINPVNWSFDWTQTTTVWAGVIAMTLYHTTVYGANQMMVQRTLAAKNIGDAKKSFLMMGFAAFFIYFFFILLGALFYHYYEGKPFENENMIILEFAASYGLPGLMGILTAAVVAASMSSLDSALNSLSTITTVDFYEKYFKPNQSTEHYLKTSRWFTVAWAVLIVLPAIGYTLTEGSILELLSKVGSYFVGAKLSMYALGFYSKHTTERGLLIGVAAGMIGVWIIAVTTSIAWPWYCLIGAAINVGVTIPASIMLDGFQKDWSLYSIRAQKAMFKEKGLQEKDNGWYIVPGKIDSASYYLLGFFVISLLFLVAIQYFI